MQVSIVGFVNWLYFIPLIKDQNYVFYNSRQTKPDQCNGLWAMETKDHERWGGGWQTLNHYRKPCTLHVFQLQGSSSLWLTARATDFLSNHACDALQSVFFKIVHCNSTCGSSYRQPALPRYSVQFLSLSLSLSWGQVNTTKLWLTCHNHLGQLINVLCGLGEASSTRVPPLHQIIHQLEYNYIFCNSMRDAN